MNTTTELYLRIFTLTFLGFAFISFVGGNISARGQRLQLLTHPVIVRIRFFSLGLFLALISQRYDWQHPGAAGFITASLLLISAIRVRIPLEGTVSSLPQDFPAVQSA